MASIVDLPLKEKEKTAVKWAIYQLSGMLAFALSQICKQIQYFSDRDKEEMIRLGLLYGKNSKAKIEDILKITNNIARKTLSTFCVEEKLIDSLPEIRLSYPDYTEAFISIIFRMIILWLFLIKIGKLKYLAINEELHSPYSELVLEESNEVQDKPIYRLLKKEGNEIRIRQDLAESLLAREVIGLVLEEGRGGYHNQKTRIWIGNKGMVLESGRNNHFKTG